MNFYILTVILMLLGLTLLFSFYDTGSTSSNVQPDTPVLGGVATTAATASPNISMDLGAGGQICLGGICLTQDNLLGLRYFYGYTDNTNVNLDSDHDLIVGGALTVVGNVSAQTTTTNQLNAVNAHATNSLTADTYISTNSLMVGKDKNSILTLGHGSNIDQRNPNNTSHGSSDINSLLPSCC